jgi:hypothetical protein
VVMVGRRGRAFSTWIPLLLVLVSEEIRLRFRASRASRAGAAGQRDRKMSWGSPGWFGDSFRGSVPALLQQAKRRVGPSAESRD